MKNLTLLLLIISLYSNAQTMCGTALEGGTINLTAPAGNSFTSITFASYGTPGGTCGSFTVGGCHAANSVSICSSAFVGQTSASINATNAVFGDPCGGTGKRLYLEVAYSTILPLRLNSFVAKKIETNKVILTWNTANEMNTAEFIIEKSSDGFVFDKIGMVGASGGGTYGFVDLSWTNAAASYYRLKMIDADGKFRFSNIIRINTVLKKSLSVFPNPVSNYLTIESSEKQEATITNAAGQLIQKISLTPGDQTLNIETFLPGVYFIKTPETVLKFFKTGY